MSDQHRSFPSGSQYQVSNGKGSYISVTNPYGEPFQQASSSTPQSRPFADVKSTPAGSKSRFESIGTQLSRLSVNHQYLNQQNHDPTYPSRPLPKVPAAQSITSNTVHTGGHNNNAAIISDTPSSVIVNRQFSSQHQRQDTSMSSLSERNYDKYDGGHDVQNGSRYSSNNMTTSYQGTGRQSSRASNHAQAQNNSQKTPILRFPLSPKSAIDFFHPQLTAYEQKEIHHFESIYFLGASTVEKIGTSKRPTGAALADICNVQGGAKDEDGKVYNDGYDDSRGDLYLTKHDHIGYRYEILSVLGKGSFGQVLKCFDHKDRCNVALKVIRNKKRFEKQGTVEVKVLKAIRDADVHNSANLIHIKDNFYFRGHLCLTFDLLGINLYEWLKAGSFRGVHLGLIRVFAVQILDCLNLLFDERIVHCDLKPENILLRDVGFAQPSRSDSNPATSSSSNSSKYASYIPSDFNPDSSRYKITVIDFGSSCYEHERLYTYVQSRFYRSPEVILGIPYKMAIDMWSFGCILAELYSGYPLFPGENEQEQLACIMEIKGVPHISVLERGSRRKVFFDSQNNPKLTPNSKGKKRRPSTKTLSSVLKCTDMAFLDFVDKCLDWDPDQRMTPSEALSHPFITGTRFIPSIASIPIKGSRSNANVGSKDPSQSAASSARLSIGNVNMPSSQPINGQQSNFASFPNNTIKTASMLPSPASTGLSGKTHQGRIMTAPAADHQPRLSLGNGSNGSYAAISSRRKLPDMPANFSERLKTSDSQQRTKMESFLPKDVHGSIVGSSTVSGMGNMPYSSRPTTTSQYQKFSSPSLTARTSIGSMGGQAGSVPTIHLNDMLPPISVNTANEQQSNMHPLSGSYIPISTSSSAYRTSGSTYSVGLPPTSTNVNLTSSRERLKTAAGGVSEYRHNTPTYLSGSNVHSRGGNDPLPYSTNPNSKSSSILNNKPGTAATRSSPRRASLKEGSSMPSIYGATKNTSSRYASQRWNSSTQLAGNSASGVSYASTTRKPFTAAASSNSSNLFHLGGTEQQRPAVGRYSFGGGEGSRGSYPGNTAPKWR